jgi:hypothetical protein
VVQLGFFSLACGIAQVGRSGFMTPVRKWLDRNNAPAPSGLVDFRERLAAGTIAGGQAAGSSG